MKTIGKIAVEYGVTARALRFYESHKLLTPGRRGTERIYSEKDEARLRIVLEAKGLGFALGDIPPLIVSTGASEVLHIPPDIAKRQLATMRQTVVEAKAAVRALEILAADIAA